MSLHTLNMYSVTGDSMCTPVIDGIVLCTYYYSPYSSRYVRVILVLCYSKKLRTDGYNNADAGPIHILSTGGIYVQCTYILYAQLNTSRFVVDMGVVYTCVFLCAYHMHLSLYAGLCVRNIWQAYAKPH